jgi:phospho-N-acetylmuramoyl-pentapeptide-transferase
MALLLGILILSFVVTSICIVPFINLLYKFRFQRHASGTKDAFGKLTPIFDYFHRDKAGTPIGGGLLVIILVTLLFSLIMPLVRYAGIDITHIYPIKSEVNIILFTFISFGILGLYDDIMKFFGVKQTGFFGLRLRHKFIIQWVLAFIIAVMIYRNLGIDIINIPSFGVLNLGYLFIPFAAFVIVSFTNAVNISDGLDGLASGVLLIALFALWILASSILDTPLSIFLVLWIGALIAFLYFNVYPARLFLGDVGALSFGATIAVVGLLVGKILAVTVIGGFFVLELTSSLLQLLSKKFRGKKLLPVAPLHLWFQYIGWEEPKIVQRVWLASMMLAIFGLWLAVI